MIRAILATITPSSDGEKVSLDSQTDRETIAKIIRQGGRRVWVDAVDPDESERGWLTATFNLPPALLSAQPPLFSDGLALTACLPFTFSANNIWNTLPVLVIAKPDVLLTVHEARVAPINRVFARAAQSPLDWKTSTAPLAWNVIVAVIEPTFTAQSEAINALTELSQKVVNNTQSRAVPSLIAAIYAQRLRADELLALTVGYDAWLRRVTLHPLLATSTDLAAQAEQLVGRLARYPTVLDRQIAALAELTTLAMSQQTAELIRRTRGIGAMLLIPLTIIAITQLMVILPLTTDSALAAALAIIVIAVLVAIGLGRRRGWL